VLPNLKLPWGTKVAEEVALARGGGTYRSVSVKATKQIGGW
jgi:hypothetical protein